MMRSSWTATSADDKLAGLILEWLDEMRNYQSFYQLPKPPAEATIGEVVAIGRDHGADVDRSLDRLERTNDEIRTYIGRVNVSGDAEDIRIFTDEVAHFIEHHREQSDMTSACWPLIPESLYSKSGEGVLGETPGFLDCLIKVAVAGAQDPPDMQKLTKAADTVYDQISATGW